MNFSCGSCQARYSIADHKVRAKVVKIRCRRCATIIVASEASAAGARECVGAPAETAAPKSSPRTGARHDQSVLFSLASLRGARPCEEAADATSDSSGMIDLRILTRAMERPESRSMAGDAILHLGPGGVFAPALLPGPGEGHEPAPPASRPGSTGRAVWQGLALLIGLTPPVGLTLSLVRALHRPDAAPPRIPVVAVTEATALPSDVASALPTHSPGPPRASDTSPPPVATARTIPARRPQVATVAEPVPAEKALEAAHTCCPGESETTCEMRRSIGATCALPPAEAPATFDSAAASRALAAVDLRPCAKAGGSARAGHARVTFQPTGAVSDAVVDTPELSATTIGRCVAQAYRRVTLQAFSGPMLTVGKRFVVPDP